MDYVVSIFKKLLPKLKNLKGLEIEYEPPILRHFNAKLKPIQDKNLFIFF